MPAQGCPPVDGGVKCKVDANLSLMLCLSRTTGDSFRFGRILQPEMTRNNDMRVESALDVFHGDRVESIKQVNNWNFCLSSHLHGKCTHLHGKCTPNHLGRPQAGYPLNLFLCGSVVLLVSK